MWYSGAPFLEKAAILRMRAIAASLLDVLSYEKDKREKNDTIPR